MEIQNLINRMLSGFYDYNKENEKKTLTKNFFGSRLCSAVGVMWDDAKCPAKKFEK